MNLDILYEDNHVIVVYKPSGILSQKDYTQDLDMLTLVKEYIKIKYNKPGDVYLGLVHRLDRMTSGIMVFARTSKAASRLSSNIKEHLFEKSYLAVLSGVIDSFVDKRVTCKLEKNEKLNKSFVSKSGKESILDIHVLSSKKNTTLVEIALQTGRHHQIRAMMAHFYFPLMGDLKYGAKEGKLALQAFKLAFNHPITKEKMTFTKVNYDGCFKDYQGDII